MYLLTPLTSLTLLFTIVVPSIVASPVEQSSNNALEQRAAPLALVGNRQCSNPAQMNLLGDPGLNQVGSCGWKMWAACSAIAGGVCLVPCIDGGFADPLCDACVAAMGVLGCKSCIQNRELETTLQTFFVDKQDIITQKLQSQYCSVPKSLKDVPRLNVKAPEASTGAQVAPTDVPTA